MREIGDYIELDTYHLPMLHEGSIALNCGRNALAYLLRARNTKKNWHQFSVVDLLIGFGASIYNFETREGTK